MRPGPVYLTSDALLTKAFNRITRIAQLQLSTVSLITLTVSLIALTVSLIALTVSLIVLLLCVVSLIA